MAHAHAERRCQEAHTSEHRTSPTSIMGAQLYTEV